MNARSKNDIDHDERLDMWAHDYHGKLDPHAVLEALVVAAADYLTLILGADAVDAGMSEMLRRRAGRCDGPWREALRNEEVNLWTETELGQLLFDAGAYAFYGIGPSEAQAIEDMVAFVSAFCSRSPTALWLDAAAPAMQPSIEDREAFGTWLMANQGRELRKLVMLAENRWALDNDRPVEPAALAIFGGVGEPRIHNMTAGVNRTFNKDADGRIPAHEALAWLDGRESFWPSIWRTHRSEEFGAPSMPVARPVFVPVARDGSIFHPGLARNGTFTVGPKGEEVHEADFETALAMLQGMPSPFWRRPNERGSWGIVRGMRWERLDRAELDHFIRNPGRRLAITP